MVVGLFKQGIIQIWGEVMNGVAGFLRVLLLTSTNSSVKTRNLEILSIRNSRKSLTILTTLTSFKLRYTLDACPIASDIILSPCNQRRAQGGAGSRRMKGIGQVRVCQVGTCKDLWSSEIIKKRRCFFRSFISTKLIDLFQVYHRLVSTVHRE